MSTYLYLQCEDHTPPIRSFCHSGQHLRDLAQIFKDIDSRELIVAAYNEDMVPMHNFRRATASFLAQHPHCRVTVIDEYGRTHTPEEVTNSAEVEGA